MRKTSLVFMLVLLASCGKTGPSSDPRKFMSTNHLDGKTDAEILKLKYDHQVRLNCSVRIQSGRAIDQVSRPVDEFSIDLSKRSTEQKTLNFKVGRRKKFLAIKTLKAIEFVDHVSHTDERKQEFFMEHSPVLAIAFKRGTKSMIWDESNNEARAYDHLTLYENVEHRLYTITSILPDDSAVTEEARCTLSTQIMPEYQDQWRRIK